MTVRTARLLAGLVMALVFAGCGASPTGPSATVPASPLDQTFARICPGCTVSGPAAVRTGTLSISESQGAMMPSREVEVGTIRLTIRPLTGITFNGTGAGETINGWVSALRRHPFPPSAPASTSSSTSSARGGTPPHNACGMCARRWASRRSQWGGEYYSPPPRATEGQDP